MMELDFDSVLDDEKIVALIGSPLFQAFADALPARSELGRNAQVTPAVAALMGAAIPIVGGAKMAERTILVRWNAFRRVLLEEGYEVPLEPPNKDHWWTYRKDYLPNEEALVPLHGAFAEASVAMSNDIGLALPLWGEPNYLDADPGASLYSDGCWFLPASEIGFDPNAVSRHSPGGAPRIVTDAVTQSDRAYGYPLVSLGLRGPGERRRIILDVGVGKKGDPASEVEYAIGLLRRNFHLLDGRVSYWLYDGAMSGVHHRTIREEFGILTVTRTVTRKAPRAWITDVWRAPVARRQVLQLDLPNCTHWLATGYGAVWEVEKATPRFTNSEIRPAQLFGRYERPLRVLDVRRAFSQGSYRWEMDIRIHCPYGPHIVTVDPNGWGLPHTRKLSDIRSGHRIGAPPTRLVKPSKKNSELNVAEQVRVIDQTRTHRFAQIYGGRNDVESWHQTLKNVDGYGDRSQVFSRSRFLLDIMFLTMVRNTLAWMEHKDTSVVAVP
jgi:hypothetical protein